MVITAGVLGYGGGVEHEWRARELGRGEGRERQVKECEELKDIRTGSMRGGRASKHSASD